MENTKIQWTNSTHNFWTGCHKISEGCKFCYMHRIIDGQNKNPNQVIRANDKYFYKPYFDKEPKLIFTCSMSDFFIDEADEWRDRAWATIKNTPWHTWQILTKRPERILECLPADWGDGYPNVWLGVTIENQKNIHRMLTLAKIPAALRFISAEPLLEEIDLLIKDAHDNAIIDAFQWLILGGESGFDTGKYKYRPCEVAWLERAENDLKANSNAKIFVKQMGTYLAHQGIGSVTNGKWCKSFHGDDFARFPDSLKIREMPDTHDPDDRAIAIAA